MRKLWENGFNKGAQQNQELISQEQYPFFSNGRYRRAYMDMAGDITLHALLEVVPPNSTTLDLGCGDGIDMINLHANGHSGLKIGLEQPVKGNPGATLRKFGYLTENLEKHGLSEARILVGDMHEIPLPDESVDVLVAAAVLQHAKNVKRVLREIRRVAKNGARLVVVTNFQDNKPLHHRELQIAAKRLNGHVQPFSAPFHFDRALTLTTSQPGYEYVRDFVQGEYKNNLVLRTDEDIATLRLSVNTYRQSIKPNIDRSWSEKTKNEVIEKFEWDREHHWQPIMRDMVDRVTAIRDRDGAVYETIHRGAIEFRIEK